MQVSMYMCAFASTPPQVSFLRCGMTRFFMEEGPFSDWKPVKQVRTAGHQIPEVTVSVSLVLGS